MCLNQVTLQHSSPFPACKNIKTSCLEKCVLIMGLFLVVMGSLWVSGVFSPGNMGVILPMHSFGAAVEGGFCIALGSNSTLGVVGRMLSPRFRNCTNG